MRKKTKAAQKLTFWMRIFVYKQFSWSYSDILQCQSTVNNGSQLSFARLLSTFYIHRIIINAQKFIYTAICIIYNMFLSKHLQRKSDQHNSFSLLLFRGDISAPFLIFHSFFLTLKKLNPNTYFLMFLLTDCSWMIFLTNNILQNISTNIQSNILPYFCCVNLEGIHPTKHSLHYTIRGEDILYHSSRRPQKASCLRK